MSPKKNNQDVVLLRQEAEAQAASKPMTLHRPQPGEELLHELIHELRVHKIELEMQNEQLRQTQLELEKSRDRYVEYYDFAPVGYLTLDRHELIEDINLTGAGMLGVERAKLMHRRFAPFVVQEDTDRWHRHFLAVLQDENTSGCELALRGKDGARIHAILNCLMLKKEGQEDVVRVVLTDISELKQLRAALQEAKP